MTLTLHLAPTIQEGAACGAPYVRDPAKCCRIPNSAFRILRGTHDFADIFMLRCVRCSAAHVSSYDSAKAVDYHQMPRTNNRQIDR